MYDKYTPVCNDGSFSLLICLDAYRLNGGGLLKVRAPNRAYLCQPSVPEQSRTTSTLLLLKRRIGNGNTRLRIAESLACSRNHYRAENLCYQSEQGQKLLPQFRKIVCLVNCTFGANGISKSSFCHCEEQRELRRGNLAERNAPDGWFPTLTL